MNDDKDNAIQLQLAELFGQDTVEHASLIDVADLNLDEHMIASITSGVTRLKRLRSDPAAQQKMVATMTPGERLLLCMWVMEMDLLDKIRGTPD